MTFVFAGSCGRGPNRKPPLRHGPARGRAFKKGARISGKRPFPMKPAGVAFVNMLDGSTVARP